MISAKNRLFGELAAGKGYVNEKQLAECYDELLQFAKKGKTRQLSLLLIKKDYITYPQAEEIQKSVDRDYFLCDSCDECFDVSLDECPHCGNPREKKEEKTRLKSRRLVKDEVGGDDEEERENMPPPKWSPEGVPSKLLVKKEETVEKSVPEEGRRDASEIPPKWEASVREPSEGEPPEKEKLEPPSIKPVEDKARENPRILRSTDIWKAEELRPDSSLDADFRKRKGSTPSTSDRGEVSGRLLRGVMVGDLLERDDFGQVYEGTSPEHSDGVLVRVFTSVYRDRQEGTASLQKRLGLVSEASGPMLVKHHASGFSDRLSYLITEKYSGRVLSDKIGEKGPLEIEEAVGILRKTAEGLSALHRVGAFHGCLNASSVIVLESGEIKLRNAGFLGNGELKYFFAEEPLLHDPETVAPEVIDSRKPGVSGDIFALGALAYYMVAGKRSAGADEKRRREVADEILNRPYLELPGESEKNMAISVCIRKMTSRNPENRYKDADAIIRDLDIVEAGKTPEWTRRKTDSRRIILPAVSPEKQKVGFRDFLPFGVLLAGAALLAFALFLKPASGDLFPEGREPFNWYGERARSEIEEVEEYAERNPGDLEAIRERYSRIAAKYPRIEIGALAMRRADEISARAAARHEKLKENVLAKARALAKEGMLVDAMAAFYPRGEEASFEKEPLYEEIAERLRDEKGMVFIPAGKALMPDGRERETEPFAAGVYEVTCEQYGDFLKATERHPPAAWKDAKPPRGWERKPVTGVSLEEARAYAEWAGASIPDEAQWIRAARGSLNGRYPWGDDFDPHRADVGGELSDVDSRPGGESIFGCLGMTGGALEWTSTGDPENKGSFFLKGGSAWGRPENVTVENRISLPGDISHEYAGFRVIIPAGEGGRK